MLRAPNIWPASHEELIIDIVNKVRRYIPLIQREVVITAFNLEYDEDNPISCVYCRKILKHKFFCVYPYKDVPSIDHMIPRCMNGRNAIDNMALCCNECNVVKCTMKAQSFMELIHTLEPIPGLKKRVFDQLWKGRVASRNERRFFKPYAGKKTKRRKNQKK